MEFMMGMLMGIIGVFTAVTLIISIEENKNTNKLMKMVNVNTNGILQKQELIINEIGVDLNKQKQS